MGLCANYKVIVATKYSTKHGFIARVAMVFFKLMKLTLSLTIITAAQNVSKKFLKLFFFSSLYSFYTLNLTQNLN